MTLKRIISGGQTGADQAALDSAIEYGFPYGGWIPKGRLTESGPLQKTYRLQEMPTKDYRKRTLQNILDSDGTVIISRGKLTGGSKLTREYANKHKKPNLHIDLYKTDPFHAISVLYASILIHKIQVLNVAGARASKDPDIYEDVKFIIQSVLMLTAVEAPPGAKFEDYSEEEFLEKLPFKPKTVEQAVDQLERQLDLQSRVKLARMSAEQMLGSLDDLFPHFNWAFGEWLDTPEFIADCNTLSPEPIKEGFEATAVVMAMLWKHLHETHRMKVVK